MISILVLSARFQAHLRAKIFLRNSKKYIAPVTVTFMTDAPTINCAPQPARERGEAQARRRTRCLPVWQSLAVYKRQCSLYKWAYWVTHNVGVSHIQPEKRRPGTVSLVRETLDVTPIIAHGGDSVGWRDARRYDWLFW